MPRDAAILQRRNIFILQRFRYHCKRNPKWRTDAILEMVAEEFFLSIVTVTKIIRQDDQTVPDPRTISRQKAQVCDATAA
ncbi:MAG TPA: hypothetical protein PKM63_21825 [Panacibacter sp.]|nr:hypothetical protein [Panacibacter sp.]HNP46952.1 hypothetical protein [Panacibacter sp.]